MFREKKSFFDRFTGILNTDEQDSGDYGSGDETGEESIPREVVKENWADEDTSDGQLTVDVYQLPNEIVIQTIVAGVRPDDLDVSITREMVTIKGKRERAKQASQDNYFYSELYWGSFSRTILLPEEIDVEASEATEQHGLLTLRLPKIDKKKSQKLKVRTH